MTVSVSDETAGLSFLLPDGWVQAPDAPVAILAIDEIARQAGAEFVTNLVATVSPRQDAVDLDAVTVHAVETWLDTVPFGHVLGSLAWSPDDGRYDSRLVFATYSNGIQSLTLLTALILADGIVTRIDLTAPAALSRPVTELFYDALDGLVVPTDAPGRDLSGEDLAAYQERLTDKVLPQ